MLGTSCHNGFPIIVSRDRPRVCGLILRRQLMVLLNAKTWLGAEQAPEELACVRVVVCSRHLRGVLCRAGSVKSRWTRSSRSCA